MTKMPERESW